MDAKTEKALRESIAKWEKNSRVRNLENAKIDAQDCPLCRMFNDYINPELKEGCIGCPVQERSGFEGCVHTPFDDAARAWAFGGASEFRAAARKEVAFLKSLLPENTQ